MCKTCALGIAVPLIFQTPSLYKQTFAAVNGEMNVIKITYSVFGIF